MAAYGNLNGSLGDEQRSSSDDEDDGYSRLDQAHMGNRYPYLEDSFDSSLSGSYENPEVLDRTPAQLHPSVERPYHTHDIEEALDEGERSSSGTLTPDYRDPAFSYQDFSNSNEEQHSTLPIHPLEGSTAHTINILGSLCLRSVSENDSRFEDQGIYQGLMMSNQYREMMDVFPDALCMTVNLEQHQAELEGLSVQVMKKTEIVPQTPFECGVSNTRKRYSVPIFSTTHVANRAPSPTSDSTQSRPTRPSMVTYTGNILRPTPLPPLDESLPIKERKRYRVIESLIESEAAYLTSLNIAVKVYKNPLVEACASNPLIDKEQVWRLFGPVEKLMDHHELFFAALSQRTKYWAPEKDIGDLFVSSFHRSEVRNNYSEYVNNFTLAMSILETGIKKKQRFVGFLRQQMLKSNTSLSLQALLLKPIQRFVQYKLFLQDLIKYTPVSHHDRMVLQIALVNVEQTTDYLNEAKRNSEQKSIVHHLQTHITKVPVKLLDSCSMLVKHSVIKLVKCSGGKVQMKERRLLLLDKVVVCLGVKEGKRIKPKAEQVLGEISAHRLVYKWHCMVADLVITDPDHTNLDVSLAVIGKDNSQMQDKFLKLVDDMKQMDNDFQHLTKISALVSFLHKEYEGLSKQQIDSHINVLQRNLNSGRELLRNCEAGRLDLKIPRKEGSSQVYTLVFMSEKEKEDWLKSLHFIKLKQIAPNAMSTWLKGDDCEEVAEENSVDGKKMFQSVAPMLQLPLVVDYYRLNQNTVGASVGCATCVGANRAWVASGTDDSGQVTVIQCLHPAPIVIESFPIDCNRILCMKAVPSFAFKSDNKPMTVWIGSHSGGLLVYDAVSAKCVASTRVSDSILCIEKYRSRVFVGAADGNLFVFAIPKDGVWNLTEFKTIPVSKSPIHCMCVVGSQLWMGVGNSCTIINMGSLRLEHDVKVVDDPAVSVSCLESSGSGVWVSTNSKATLYLFHKDSRKIIQEIDVRSSLERIVQFCSNRRKFNDTSSLRLTSLMASAGFLWVGTSEGAILLYRIPRPKLKGPPIITSKPFLASDGHKQPVQFLISVETKLDISTSRFDQFLLNEKQTMLPASSYASPLISSSQPVEQQRPQSVHSPKASPRSTEAPLNQSSLLLSTRVDESAPPPVSLIIKKLEEKGPFTPVSPPAGEQRLPSLPRANVPESGTAVEGANEQAEDAEKSAVTADRPLSSMYDNPGDVLDTYPQATEPPESIYDSVPLEFEYSYGEGNGEEKGDALEEGGGARESGGDLEKAGDETLKAGSGDASFKWKNELNLTESADINPSRYQPEVPAEDNGTLYSKLSTAASTLNSQMADHLHADSTTFIFSGGTGISNFRSTDAPSPLLLPEKRDSIAFGDDNMDEIPCVLSYQIPSVFC